MFRNLIGACVGLAIMGVAGTASAALVTFVFEAEQTSVSGTAFEPFLGDTASGSFSVETSTVGTAPLNGRLFYADGSPLFTFSTSNTSTSNTSGFTATNLDINLGNDETSSGTDRFELRTFLAIGPPNNTGYTGDVGGTLVNFVSVFLINSAGTAFSSNALFTDPTLFDPLSQFDLNTIDFGGSGFNASYSVTSISVVPLPAAFPLMGTGLALLGFMGWRRKRKANAA